MNDIDLIDVLNNPQNYLFDGSVIVASAVSVYAKRQNSLNYEWQVAPPACITRRPVEAVTSIELPTEGA